MKVKKKLGDAKQLKKEFQVNETLSSHFLKNRINLPFFVFF